MTSASRGPLWCLFWVSAAHLLTACSPQSAYGQYFQAVQTAVGGSFGNHAVNRNQVSIIPYSSIGYRVDEGPEHILILESNTYDDEIWTSAAHVVLLTRGGRLIKSIGLPYNRSGTVPTSGTILPTPKEALQSSYASERSADFPDISAYSVQLSCFTQIKGLETIKILGSAIATSRIDEACRGNNFSWSFTDSYWLDQKSGFVWRSFQHVHPRGETLEIEVFRPPS